MREKLLDKYHRLYLEHRARMDMCLELEKYEQALVELGKSDAYLVKFYEKLYGNIQERKVA